MKWRGREQSSNVEDRRGQRMGGGGLFKGGIGGIVLLLVAWYFGIDPQLLMQGAETLSPPASTRQSGPSPETTANGLPVQDEHAQFIATVLADTETAWQDIFRVRQSRYQEPRLVLFTDATPTACGTGQSAMGPFYCPADRQVYIDLGFYRELSQRFGAPGDFAQAYVIAHEVGHHVQNLLGTASEVHAQRQRVSEAESNALSVRMELQADCYAGVWAHFAQNKGYLEAGDIDEALTAASAIGDDTLQKRARGTVVPESFTHGSAAQRQHWFRQGWQSGRPEDCNTFGREEF